MGQGKVSVSSKDEIPKSLSPQQATGLFGILPLWGSDFVTTKSQNQGYCPAEPLAPAIHPTSKLAGILATINKVLSRYTQIK